MNAVDWGVLVVLCCAASIAAVTSWFVLRELRRRREAVAAPPPPRMERHQLRITLHHKDALVYDQKFTTKAYAKGAALSSDPSIRYFLKWYHGRVESPHIVFKTTEDGVTMIPRVRICRYGIERIPA